jgi:peptidoglycan/xylan/chitin deacetylase (PgdA/CDA1 family)
MRAEPASNGGRGALVISLDFELHWGVRDSKPLDSYRQNLLGVRTAVPAMLKLFAQYGIHATWAAVGFIFFEKKDDLLASLPTSKPAYRNPRFSPYEDLDGLGANESEDPLHFGASLIRQVSAAPDQEIGSHTFSHYYCLEEGQDLATFRADLEAAQRAAARHGLELRSLVFPRNQYSQEYVAACAEMGFAAYRGNQASWLYQSRSKGEESLLRRALRLADAYVGITSHHCCSLDQIRQTRPFDIPASRFLRPYSPSLAAFEPLRRRRILRGLEHAAENGVVYHLWWHPHNFGVNTAENLAFLEKILERFAELREARGMESLNMGEISRRLGAAGAGAQ